MPTKFYFHDATTTVGGTLPDASVMSGGPNEATGCRTNRTMNDTIGTGQVSSALTTQATTGEQHGWFRRFMSDPLEAQTISAQTVTLSIAASESNAASDAFEGTGLPGVYLWRPSTGTNIGTIVLFGPMSAEPGTSQTAINDTGTSISRTAQAGDVIVIELMSKQNQSMGSAYTNTFFYDGTTEASTTNCASFLEFTNNITLETGPVTHNLAGDITLAPALDGAVGRDTFAAGDIAFNPALDGAVGRETNLAGDVALDIAVDGNIAIVVPAHALAGDIAFDPVVDGAVARTTSLAGDVALDPAVDGAIGRTTSLAGDITYVPVVDGAISRTTFVVGDVDLTFAVDGDIVITGGAVTHDLAGDIAFDPTLDGAFTRTTFTAGDIAFDPALDVAVIRTTSLAGDIALDPALDGALRVGTSLVGDIALVVAVDGNIALAATVVPSTVRAADTFPRATVAADLDPPDQTAQDLTGVLVAARDLVP